MKKIAVLFDCDGVLVDSEAALAEISARVLQRYGWAAKPADFYPYIGTGEDSYIGSVVEHYGGQYTETIKSDVYDAYIAEGAAMIRSFPACLDLLDYLRERAIPMVVASSADRIKVDINLAAIGLKEDDFTSVISGSDIERKKPFPDIYLLAAERAAVSAEACLVVEDAVAGIMAGKAAGMTSIGFTSNCTAESLYQAGADYVVDDFSELRELIDRLCDI